MLHTRLREAWPCSGCRQEYTTDATSHFEIVRSAFRTASLACACRSTMHSLILKRYLAHNSGQAVHALQLHPQAKHRHCYHNSTFGSIHYLYSAAYHSQQGSTKPHLLHHRHRHYYSCSIAPVSVLRKVSASSCCLETSPVVGEAAVSWCTPAIFTSTKTSSPLLFPHLRRRGATPHTTFPLVSPTS